eukprot:s893_g1.t1
MSEDLRALHCTSSDMYEQWSEITTLPHVFILRLSKFRSALPCTPILPTAAGAQDQHHASFRLLAWETFSPDASAPRFHSSAATALQRVALEDAHSHRTADSLLATYRPDLLHLPTTNGEHCTGDAIKMGEAIGAATIDLEWVQVHPTGLVKPDDPDAKVKFLAAEALRGVGGIVLDANGDRFCNELGRRDYETFKGYMDPPGSAPQPRKNKPPFRLCLNKAAADEIIWHAKHYTGRGVMKFYASGEDLAKDMGVPLQRIVDAHQKHFEAAKKQEKDPDGGPFPAYPSGKTWDEPSGKTGSGKKFFHNIIDGSKVPTEPFYVAIITPVIHYCMGGLECTVDAECIDKKSGKVIPGLYVAGEAAGGIHGNNRLGGNSLLDCVVFGRVAGKAACKFTFGAGEKFKPCPPPGELKDLCKQGDSTSGRAVAKAVAEEAQKILSKHPERIPVICERFVVHGSMLCGEFKYIVHKQIADATPERLAVDQTTLGQRRDMVQRTPWADPRRPLTGLCWKPPFKEVATGQPRCWCRLFAHPLGLFLIWGFGVLVDVLGLIWGLLIKDPCLTLDSLVSEIGKAYGGAFSCGVVRIGAYIVVSFTVLLETYALMCDLRGGLYAPELSSLMVGQEAAVVKRPQEPLKMSMRSSYYGSVPVGGGDTIFGSDILSLFF